MKLSLKEVSLTNAAYVKIVRDRAMIVADLCAVVRSVCKSNCRGGPLHVIQQEWYSHDLWSL